MYRYSNLVLFGVLALGAACTAPQPEVEETRQVASAGTHVGSSPENGSSTDVWIEYTITGDVDITGREEDVMLCSNTEDGFEARALGEWIIGFETDGSDPGEHAVQFEVAAPKSVTELSSDYDGRDWRLRGEGTITIESAGTGQLGLSLIKAEFTSGDLKSETGHTIQVTGTLGCAVM